MSLPLFTRQELLAPEDFALFSSEFSRIVQHFVPYAEGPVTFISLRENGENTTEIAGCPATWEQNIRQAAKQKHSVINIEEAVVFMPVWNGEDLCGTAVLEGMDTQFIKALSNEWLNDRSHTISREFSLCKKLFYDPTTGFLNGRYLRSEISSLLEEGLSFTLVFIELNVRTGSTEKALRYISKAGYHLGSCFLDQPLVYLGFGAFAFVWIGTDELPAQKHGKIILDLLRREDFTHVRLGMTTVSAHDLDGHPSASDSDVTTENLLDQAWQALLAARRRGPYSLCSYNALAKNSDHPLARPAVSVQVRMRHQWQDLEHFCVVYLPLTRGERQENFSKRLLSLLGDQSSRTIFSERGIYVLLPNADVKQATGWAEALNGKIKQLGEKPLSMGIAAYPTALCKKSDTLLNAKKALQHANFFSLGSIVAFDAVSQNISGDIFYREGDLNRAGKEYRLGLLLEPGNVNLLNSLGETYAQMNRHAEAMRYFSRVIEIDAENYMALFNLGVVCSQMERDEEAVAYFEKAHRVAAKNLKQDADNQANGYDVSHDLLLPLGRLYCRTGKYREAVDLLAVCAGGGNCRSLEIRKKNQRHGGVLRYLGKAYKQLGMHQEAMAVLQRAIHHNPHDATSLSLLGELYCLENQGVEIALSLCGRAIEFDETRSDYWYRLGWVCVQCGRYEDARNALEESIVRDRKDLAAKYLLGVVYQHLADRPRAEKMFKQILKQRPSCKKAITALVKVRNG